MKNNPTPLPLTLCFIDDDKEDLEIFEQAVEGLVEKVALFRIGADFLTSMQNPPVRALIFVDLNMPSFTGFQIIEYLRKAGSFTTLPIIVLSTSNDYRSQQTCWDLGADYYIVKPNRIDELTHALKYVIGVDWSKNVRQRDAFVYSKKNIEILIPIGSYLKKRKYP